MLNKRSSEIYSSSSLNLIRTDKVRKFDIIGKQYLGTFKSYIISRITYKPDICKAVSYSNLNTLQIFINNFKNCSNYLILNGIKE